MTPVPLVPPEQASEELQAVYERIAGARGGHVGNVFQALGASPASLDVVARVGAHFRASETLDPVVKELLVLAVAAESRCAYEWAHHWRAVTKLGMEPAVVMEHLAGSSDPAIRPIVSVARALAARRPVDPVDLAAIREHHGDAAMVDVVTMAGYYVLLAGTIEALEVPLEPWAKPRPFPATRR